MVLILIVILLWVISLITNNPISSPRLMFGMVVISLFLCISYVKAWSVGKVFTWSYVSMFILVLPVMDLFRVTVDDIDILDVIGTIFDDFTVNLVANGDFDSFQQILNIVQYVGKNDFSYGYQFLGVIFFWMPRSVWAGKPFETGAIVAESAGYDFTSLSAPLWGEAYINFGLIGVAVTFYMLGRFLRKIGYVYVSGLKNNHIQPMFIISFILIPYLLYFLRGSLLSAVLIMSPMILVPFLMGFVSKLYHRYR